MTGRLKQGQCGGMTTKRFGGSDLLAPRGDNKHKAGREARTRLDRAQGKGTRIRGSVRYECLKQSCISDAL